MKFRKKFVMSFVNQKKRCKPRGSFEEIDSWFGKHNRHLALWFAILMFFSIFIWGVAVNTKNDTEMFAGNVANDKREFLQGFGTCQNTSEEIVCQNFNNFTDLINKINEKDGEFLKIKLENCNFDSKTIEDGWLEGVTLTTVQNFELNNVNIEVISKGALSTKPFEYLKVLKITNSEIKLLTRDMFYNLNNLENFHFDFDDKGVITAEEGALSGMSNSITILLMQKCLDKDTNLKYLFGGDNRLLKVKILDISFNYIQRLEGATFVALTGLNSLYLQENLISYIHKDAFEGLSQLQLLNLAKNNLVTLEGGTFNYINHFRNLSLNENIFECNCSLKWLQDYYFNTGLAADAFCDNVPITDYIFDCDDFEATTTLKPEDDIDLAGNLLNISCIEKISPENLQNKVRIGVVHLIVKNKMYDIDIEALESEPAQIYMDVKGCEVANSCHFVWFNAYDSINEKSCVRNVTDRLLLNKFTRNHTYTFCLLFNETFNIEPYNCFGVKVPVAWGYRTWLENNKKKIALGMTSTLILGSVLLTSMFVFFCIWKYPRLIKSNNRVILIKKNKQNQVQYERRFENPPYVAPSHISLENMTIGATSGYLTPKYHRYEQVRYQGPSLRNVPEENIYEDEGAEFPRHVYESADGSIYDKNGSIVERYYDKDYSRETPPLPPPNYRRVKSENIYSIA